MPGDFRTRLIAELRECEALGEFVEIHKWDDDPTIFLVGVITRVTARTVTFDDIDTDGALDEPITTPLANIVLIRRNTAYLRRLRKLHDDKVAQSVNLNPREGRRKDIIRRVVAEAFQSREIVCIWIDNLDRTSGIYGIVKGYSDDHIELNDLDETGYQDGAALYRMKEVKRIRAGTMHEQVMTYAHQNPTPLA